MNGGAGAATSLQFKSCFEQKFRHHKSFCAQNGKQLLQNSIYGPLGSAQMSTSLNNIVEMGPLPDIM